MIQNPSQYQLNIFDALLNTDKNVIIKATAGCLAPDTLILMYNGTLKTAKDIKVGDKIMGSDSIVRNVLRTQVGISQLYKIVPQKGESWTCNDSHILTVYDRDIYKSIKTYKGTAHKTPLRDVSIQTLLGSNTQTLSKGVKNNKLRKFALQRTGVQFKKQKTILDPYLMGLWLGDGTITGPYITTIDQEIIDYCMSIKIQDIVCKIRTDKTCQTISLTTKNHSKKKNIIYREFKKAIKNGEKYIPHNYLVNNRINQLRLLAGLIDTDGYVGRYYIEITQKSTSLANDIVFLCRSLGYAAYMTKVKRGCQTGAIGEYNHISISGDLSEVPTILPRKKIQKRIKEKSVLRTAFEIQPVGVGRWCGFQVDKDNRFLLGDFTITHNSGKTSTIVTAAKLLSPSVNSTFVAFNKSIVEHLKEKLPTTTVCKTAHSYGMTALIEYYRINFKVNPLKNLRFIDEILKKHTLLTVKEKIALQFIIVEILDLVRMNMLPYTLESISEVCDHHSIVLEHDHMIDCIEILYRMEYNNKSFSKSNNTLDFTDMIYLSVGNPKIRLPQFDCVFVDELQDMNKAQQLLIEKLRKPKGRVIGVGDYRQSIYQFAGASGDSFQYFQDKPNTITLPLSISYRCSKAIVRNAREVYPEIDFYDKNEEGEVREGSMNEVEINDIVICRNTKPLVALYLGLLRLGKPAKILGKDIEAHLLKTLSKVVNCDTEKGIDKLLEERLKLKNELIAQKKNVNYNKKYINLSEQVQVIMILAEGCDHMSQVEKKIKEMFDEDRKGAIRLLTIHKSKGMENDRVFLITHFENKKLIPSSYAVRPWELIAEQNVLFVALTRAKKSLIMLRL